MAIRPAVDYTSGLQTEPHAEADAHQAPVAEADLLHINGISDAVSPAQQVSPAQHFSPEAEANGEETAHSVAPNTQATDHVAADSKPLEEVHPPSEESEHDLLNTTITMEKEDPSKDVVAEQPPKVAAPHVEAHDESVEFDLLNSTVRCTMPGSPGLTDLLSEGRWAKPPRPLGHSVCGQAQHRVPRNGECDQSFSISKPTVIQINSSTDLLDNVHKPQPTLNLDDSETF